MSAISTFTAEHSSEYAWKSEAEKRE